MLKINHKSCFSVGIQKKNLLCTRHGSPQKNYLVSLGFRVSWSPGLEMYLGEDRITDAKREMRKKESFYSVYLSLDETQNQDSYTNVVQIMVLILEL
jgi:RNA recognition motif-containing protein